MFSRFSEETRPARAHPSAFSRNVLDKLFTSGKITEIYLLHGIYYTILTVAVLVSFAPAARPAILILDFFEKIFPLEPIEPKE
jgi:hypothetical protein